MIYLPIGMKSETAPHRSDGRAPSILTRRSDRAMHVFWAKGYEGASLSNLTRAMRINRPSLYAAFGNKEQLFRKVLDRYMDGPLAYFGKALAAPKARDVIEQIFLGAARMAERSAGFQQDASWFRVRWRAEMRRVRSEGNGCAAGGQRSCVASSPSTSKAGRRSSEKRRPSRTGPLRDDCGARNGSPGSRRRQSRSTSSSRANRTARVAESVSVQNELR